jgi:hypothetical protein
MTVTGATNADAGCVTNSMNGMIAAMIAAAATTGAEGASASKERRKTKARTGTALNGVIVIATITSLVDAADSGADVVEAAAVGGGHATPNYRRARSVARPGIMRPKSMK